MENDSFAVGAAEADPNRRASEAGALKHGSVPDESASPARPPWTFLTNHAHVLLCVARQPEVRMRDVAGLVGVTERSVQRILADLEEAGFISRVHQGRRNHYEVHADLPLRHPAEQHQQVSALLWLLIGEPGSKPESEV